MKNIFLAFLMFVATFNSYAASFTSVISGAWEDGATWGHTSPGVSGTDYPGAGDVATVAGGTTVTIGATAACASLTVQSDANGAGDAMVSIGNFTLTVSGNINLSSISGDGTPTIIVADNASSRLIVTGNINFNQDLVSPDSEFPTVTVGNRGNLTIGGNFNTNDINPALYSINPQIAFGGGATATGTITYNGTGTQYILGGTYGNLVLSGGAGTKVLDPVTAITIKNAFTPNVGTGLSYTITGSTIIYSKTTAQTVRAFNYEGLTIAGTHAATSVTLESGTIKVAGTYTISATFTTGAFITAGNTFTFNGPGPSGQTVPFVSGKLTYNTITFENSSTTGALLSAAVTTTNTSGDITVTSGKFSNSGFAIAFNNSKTFTVSAGATFVLTGTSTMPTGTGLTTNLSSTSTVEYAGGTQTVASGITYGNLTFSASGTKTFASGTTNIAGNFTVTAGTPDATTNSTTLDFSGASQSIPSGVTYYNLTLSGSGTKTFGTGTTNIANTFTVSAGTPDFTTGKVSFSGASQSIPSGYTFYDLDLAGSGTKTFGTGTTGVSHTFTVTAGTPDFSTGTFSYNGASQTVLSGYSYYNLTLDGSGTKTFSSGTTTIGNTLTITAGTPDLTTNNTVLAFNKSGAQVIPALTYKGLTLSGSGAKTMTTGTNITGNFISGGLASFGTTTINFTGTSSQTITGANTWYNLVLNNTGGLSIVSGLQSIANTLTLTAGTFTVTNSTLKLLSTASKTANVAGSLSLLSGSIAVQRYISGTAGYRYLGAPGVSCSISEMQPDIRLDGMTGVTPGYPSYWPNVYNYTESIAGAFSTGWTAESSVANAMTAGKGFAVYIYQYATQTFPLTLEFSGTPNSGAQSLPVTYNSSSNTDDGWNLVSNPYTSTIDWDAASGWTRTNITGNTYYVWDNANSRYASYPAGGPGVNGGDRYIATGQGFMVKASGSPTLNMTEAVRVSNEPSPVFWKTENSPSALRLKISSNANKYEDEALIRFVSNASNLNDIEYDALKIEQNSNFKAPSISTLTADKVNTCVNSYSDFATNLAIPVKVRAGVTGVQKIELEKLNYSVGGSIFLEDLKASKVVDLGKDGSYSFIMDADTVSKERFILYLNSEPTGIVSQSKNQLDLNTYVSENNLVINLKNSDFVVSEISVYNIAGQKISQINQSEIGNNKLTVELTHNGVYFVNFKTDKGTFTKKVSFVR